MSKLLFISNLTNKITSFATSSISAAHQLDIDFYHAANWSDAKENQIQKDEELYNIKVRNVNIARSPFSKSNIEAYNHINSIIVDEGINLIHCNTPVGGVLGRLCGKKCKVNKVIYQVHGFHFYKGAPKKNWLIYYPIEKLLTRFTDAIITINKEDYEIAKKFKLRNNGKVYYVPGVGIDTKEFHPSNTDIPKKRAELGLKDTDIMLISAGELNKNKNNSVIIKALAKAKNPNIHYFLCGQGELDAELGNLAKECGVSENVHFLGYRTDIKELLSASDAFVMPSFREGLSRSLMEAMSAGLPCIASAIRGNVDLIKNDINGYLCNPTDVDGFAEAINKISSDDFLRRKMSTNNLEDIKKFDAENITKIMTEIYSEQFI